VDDTRRFQLFDQIKNPLAVTYIQFVVAEVRQGVAQTLLAPAGVTLGAEEDGALVVIDTVDEEAFVMKEGNNFGAYKARGAGY
jgi:hypothetical protein